MSEHSPRNQTFSEDVIFPQKTTWPTVRSPWPEVQSTLVTLGRAIKGFVVMSAQLEEKKLTSLVPSGYITIEKP